ncbi:MAG: putative arabinose efflux permease, family [Actinomycetia bacterium]|nr:putative arabinose efflux permease, family [Actinomycetes bacterium]
MTSALTARTDRVGAGHPAHARRRSRHHTFGFWAAALAFLVNMGFSAVPTPLYVLYQQRDHFSTIMVTVVYAVYAVGVIASLLLGGHVSDWVGRKQVFVPALLINVASGLIFLFAPSLPGLLLARVVCGISIGLTTATATAYLGELHVGVFRGEAVSPRRAQVVATAANLGGIGFGPLVAGLLAQYEPQPLRVPYILFGVVLTVLAVLVAASPETAERPVPVPRWRPQRLAVPAHARRMFFVATAAGVAAFAVYGVFNSLAPTFLAGTLHQSSHAVAGVVAFAAFAAGALAQIVLSRAGSALNLRVGPLLLIPGLALLTGGMWLPSLAMFIVGGVVTGAGGGLVFRGALAAAGSTAPPESRAEVLAGFFLGAYVGLSVPVVGLGIATQYAPAREVMVVFVVLVAVAVVLCTRAVRAEQERVRDLISVGADTRVQSNG